MLRKKRSRGLYLCAGLLLSGCSTSEASIQEKMGRLSGQEAAPFLELIREAEQPEGEFVSNHAIRLGPEGAPIVVITATTSDRAFVSIFEKAAKPLERRAGSSGAYRSTWRTSFERYGRLSRILGPPTALDMNGDQRPEVMFRVRSHLADRSANAVWICAKLENKWRVLPPPSLLRRLRSPEEGVKGPTSIYQEDKFLYFDTADQKIRLHGQLMGGGWYIVGGPDGPHTSMLAVGVGSEGEATMARHRTILGMYRFDGREFSVDPRWNAGRLFITDERLDFGEVETLPVISQGFAGILPR